MRSLRAQTSPVISGSIAKSSCVSRSERRTSVRKALYPVSMSESVVLKRMFVSRLSARFPTRCQKRYARCGRPPESRDPYTTSATPRTIGSTRIGTSAGSYSPSASWTTTISPSTSGMAARIAAPLPRFCWWTTRRPAPAAAHRSSSSEVPSDEPSSTAITCASTPSASTRSSTSPIVLRSLKTGTTKLIRGAETGVSAGSSSTSSRGATSQRCGAALIDPIVCASHPRQHTRADRRGSTFSRWPEKAAEVQCVAVAATTARLAAPREQRSLLDLSTGPFVLLGAAMAALTIYVAGTGDIWGFDFRGGIWAAGRDVLAGSSPYVAPDPAQLLAQGNAYIPPPLLAFLFSPLALLPFVPAVAVFGVACTAGLVLALQIVGARDWRGC